MITDTLIDFALDDIQPSERATAITDLSLLDWAACGIAGAAQGDFSDWCHAVGGQGDCATFTNEDRSAAIAALINGTLSHALDFDDTHFGHIGHPSVVIFSAVMACAGATKDWTASQQAALVGIEASIRVGLWLGRDHYQRGFHQTATAGAFGATLAAARICGLTKDQTRHAIGLCSTMASGLKAQFGTMGKPLNAGLAARAGVEAALWAKAGMSGAKNGLSAFATAMDAEQDPTALDTIGKVWQIETLSHKFHACCHGLHATLEALAAYDGPRDFDAMTIYTHPRWLSVCNQPDPTTGLGAKFSYRQVAAMAMAGIETGDIASFSDAGTQRVDIIEARQRIDVVSADNLSEMEARVVVKAGGVEQTFTHDLAAPLEIGTLATKLRVKTDALIGKYRSHEIWTARDQRDLPSLMKHAFR